MPLPRLELETSGFDTMLGFMHQPDEPKSLSSWEEVGNPLILHNNLHVSIVCLCTCVCWQVVIVYRYNNNNNNIAFFPKQVGVG